MTNLWFRPLLWPTLILVSGLPVLLWLGFWQLDRLEWKLGLIAQMDARLSAEPVTFDAAAITVPDDEYLRVDVTGTLVDREFHWLTQSPDFGIGYNVYQPLVLSGGGHVMVNMGFVPEALKSEEKRAPASGEVVLTALIRQGEIPGTLDAVNDVTGNIWFTRDVGAMGAETGLGAFLPYYLQKEGPIGQAEWPKPADSRIAIVNNHLDYALTWFGLAVTLIVIYIAFHIAQGRFGRPSDR